MSNGTENIETLADVLWSLLKITVSFIGLTFIVCALFYAKGACDERDDLRQQLQTQQDSTDRYKALWQELNNNINTNQP